MFILGTFTHLSRYRPPTFHVQAWYDEVKDYSFPYPQECNPYCPFKCSGPVCTHYTQVARYVSYHFIRFLETLSVSHLRLNCIISFSWSVLSSFCSWFGPPAVGLAAPSTCVTTWMCGDRFGPKPFILSATIHQSKHICCDVLSQLHDEYTGCNRRRTLNVLLCHLDVTVWKFSHKGVGKQHVLSSFASFCLFFSISLARYMTWTGETGGAIRLTNMGPRALPVLPAMEEAARTTSATNVCVGKYM